MKVDSSICAPEHKGFRRLRVLKFALMIALNSWCLASPTPTDLLGLSRKSGNEDLFSDVDKILLEKGFVQGQQNTIKFFSKHLSYPDIETWNYYQKTNNRRVTLERPYVNPLNNRFEPSFPVAYTPKYRTHEELMVAFDKDLSLIICYSKSTEYGKLELIEISLPEDYKSVIEELDVLVEKHSTQQSSKSGKSLKLR